MMKGLRQKGALFVEYALILAFVLVVGVAFLSDKGLANSVGKIFNTTGNVLATAAGDQLKQFKGFYDEHCWTSTQANYNTGSRYIEGFSTKDLIELGQGTYEVSFNLEKFKTAIGDDRDYSGIKYYLMGYTIEDGKNKTLVVDNGSPKYTIGYHDTYVVTQKDNAYTLENKGETIRLGVNFYKGSMSFANISQDKLDNAIQESLSVVKK